MHVRLVFGGGLAWCVKYILTCCNLPKVDLQLCRSDSRLVCKYSLPCCYLPKVDLQLCRSDSRLVCTSTAHHAATYQRLFRSDSSLVCTVRHAATYQRLFRSDNSLVCTVRHAATYQRLTSRCAGQIAASFVQSAMLLLTKGWPPAFYFRWQLSLYSLHAATYQRLTSSCSGQTAASFEQSPDGRGHCTTSSTCRQWVGNCLQCALGSEEMIF